MTQLPPVMDIKPRPTRSRTITSNSASRGGDIRIDIEMTNDSKSDAEDVGESQDFPLLHYQQIDQSDLPFNEQFKVRPSPAHGYGLFTRPDILHVLPDSLSRLYEACYTPTWSVSGMDSHDIIEQHQLNIDKNLLLTMTQPRPVIENEPRSTRSRTVSSTSSSRGR